jgi:hypothetical protein
MTHISRPLQIALAAMALFVVVWFLALRGHSAGSEGAGSSAPAPAAPATSAATPAESSGSGTPSSTGNVYHGSAPGVSGLTRAIAKARGAVAQSQQNGQQLHAKEAQASGSSASQAAGTTSTAGSATTPKPAGAVSSKHSAASQTAAAAKPSAASKPSAKPATGSKPANPPTSGATIPSMQVVVESELKQGKLVAILFWNPKGADDVTVRRELQSVGHSLGGKLAVHIARAGQIGSFGSFTRTAQVSGTPTIVLVNTKGQTSTLNGLTDAFSIKQAIKEAKQAK